jgi:hypothetical protein
MIERHAGRLPQHDGDLNLLPRVPDAASRFERRPADEGMVAMLGTARMTSLFGLAT